MTKIKIIYVLILLTVLSTVSLAKEKVFIIYNINNKLITNIDLQKEANYLVVLNNQLRNLDKKQIQGMLKNLL